MNMDQKTEFCSEVSGIELKIVCHYKKKNLVK